jgi:hypothetical protein
MKLFLQISEEQILNFQNTFVYQGGELCAFPSDRCFTFVYLGGNFVLFPLIGVLPLFIWMESLYHRSEGKIQNSPPR